MRPDMETANTLRSQFEKIVSEKTNGDLSTSEAIAELNQLKQKVNELLPDEETKQALTQFVFATA